MSQQPVMFGQPGPGGPAQSAPGTVPEEPRSRRTRVLAVVAAMVALGVVGGAAALAVTGQDVTGQAAPLPAATAAPVEPDATPSVEPTVPLPTAVVQGRNIFVPLLDAPAVATEAAVDPVAEAAEAAAAAEAEAQAQAAALAMEELKAQLSTLQAQLAADQDDSALLAQQEDLRLRLASLEEQYRTLADGLVPLVAVSVVAVDELEVLTIEVDGTQAVLDRIDHTEPGETAVLGANEAGEDILLRYVSYQVPDDGGDGQVVLQAGSAVYTVTVGTTLVLPV